MLLLLLPVMLQRELSGAIVPLRRSVIIPLSPGRPTGRHPDWSSELPRSRRHRPHGSRRHPPGPRAVPGGGKRRTQTSSSHCHPATTGTKTERRPISEICVPSKPLASGAFSRLPCTQGTLLGGPATFLRDNATLNINVL